MLIIILLEMGLIGYYTYVNSQNSSDLESNSITFIVKQVYV